MKKLTFATLSIIILFAAQQVAASNEHANEHANSNSGIQTHEEKENDHKTTVTISKTQPTTTTSPSFRNHGEAVSEEAHEHEGGKAVSLVAKSDAGKKHHDEEDNNDDDDNNISITPSVTPSTSPSVTPSDTPSVTPSETPSVTPSETPTATPSETLTPTVTPTEAQALGAGLKDFLEKLKDLIANFTASLHF